LDIEVVLRQVFYEEPIDEDGRMGASSMYPRKDLHLRKEMEKKKFYDFKKQGNNSEQLFLVSADWVRKWADFVKDPDSTNPGEIINDTLYMQHR
jgi:hypothetical protein